MLIGRRLLLLLCPASSSKRATIIAKRSLTFPTFNVFYGVRRRIIDRVTRYDASRVAAMGPDLACLEWLMECGTTTVMLSDGTKITTIKQMKDYIGQLGFDLEKLPRRNPKQLEAAEKNKNVQNLPYHNRWPMAPNVHIVSVDASDSVISDPGFPFLRDCWGIETMKLNFCDYFGDIGMRELSLSSSAKTLKDLEIVCNPHISDASLYWLVKLQALKRLHIYMLPWVAHRPGMLRNLKTGLPRCKVTFPETNYVGYGYDEADV